MLRKTIFVSFLVGMAVVFLPAAHNEGRHPAVKQGVVVTALLLFSTIAWKGGFGATMDQVFTR